MEETVPKGTRRLPAAPAVHKYLAIMRQDLLDLEPTRSLDLFLSCSRMTVSLQISGTVSQLQVIFIKVTRWAKIPPPQTSYFKNKLKLKEIGLVSYLFVLL